MPDKFARTDTDPVTLPKPYALLLAFLDDLSEQVGIQEATITDRQALAVLASVRLTIVAAATITRQLAALAGE